MKVCPRCGASNVSSEEFCTDCSLRLIDVPVQTSPGRPPATRKRIVFQQKNDSEGHDDSSGEPGVTRSADTLDIKRSAGRDGHGRARIMYLLDFSDNAGGKADTIRDSVKSFADGLRLAGFAVRVGLIEFRARSADENGDS